MNVSEIRWTPFATEPVDVLEDVDADSSLGGIVVALLRELRIKNELLSLALACNRDLERQLRQARSQTAALRDENRRFTRAVVSGRRAA